MIKNESKEQSPIVDSGELATIARLEADLALERAVNARLSTLISAQGQSGVTTIKPVDPDEQVRVFRNAIDERTALFGHVLAFFAVEGPNWIGIVETGLKKRATSPDDRRIFGFRLPEWLQPTVSVYLAPTRKWTADALTRVLSAREAGERQAIEARFVGTGSGPIDLASFIDGASRFSPETTEALLLNARRALRDLKLQEVTLPAMRLCNGALLADVRRQLLRCEEILEGAPAPSWLLAELPQFPTHPTAP